MMDVQENRLKNIGKFEKLRNDSVKEANKVELQACSKIFLFTIALLALIGALLSQNQSKISESIAQDRSVGVIMFIVIVSLLISLSFGIRFFFDIKKFHVDSAKAYNDVMEEISEALIKESSDEEGLAKEVIRIQHAAPQESRVLFLMLQINFVAIAMLLLLGIIATSLLG